MQKYATTELGLEKKALLRLKEEYEKQA